MKNLLFTIVIGLLISSLNAQKLEPTSHIWLSGTANDFKGGYTFSYATAGTAWNGSLISYGGFANNYDTQLSSDYFYNRISFRTRNGDANFWNPWVELATKGANDFVGNQFIHGKVGVGTNNASAQLEVYNTAQAGHLVLSANDNPTADRTRIDIDFRVANQNHTVGRISSAYLNSADGGSGALRFFTRENGDLNEKLVINSNGNTGIGIANPANKLDVNGTIHSKEVKVDMNGWSDFVFKKEYNLPTLEEVEKHIAEKGHLENIPSEKEVLQNGINLGEMNAKLLQKIEELILYMIEMKKENEAFKAVFERLSKLEEKLK